MQDTCHLFSFSRHLLACFYVSLLLLFIHGIDELFLLPRGLKPMTLDDLNDIGNSIIDIFELYESEMIDFKSLKIFLLNTAQELIDAD